MFVFFAIIGLIGVPLSVIFLIVAAVRKRPKRRPAIALVCCIAAFFCSVVLLPDTGTKIAGFNADDPACTAERGTTEMVDYIARQARADAEIATDNDLNGAYIYIRDHYTGCFGGNDAMEQMMYNGWLLEYAYEDEESMSDYYKLGQDAEQLTKYVYRGTETADEQKTQENIRQIKKSLDAIAAK